MEVGAAAPRCLLRQRTANAPRALFSVGLVNAKHASRDFTHQASSFGRHFSSASLRPLSLQTPKWCRNVWGVSYRSGLVEGFRRSLRIHSRSWSSSTSVRETSKGDIRYTTSHEYVRGHLQDGSIVDFGISCHAAEEIGELVFVEMPDVGKEIGLGDTVVTLESVKSVAEAYCPFVKAEVVELNEELRDNPKLTNDDAEGTGWIVRLKIKGEPGEAADKLMGREKYDDFLKN